MSHFKTLAALTVALSASSAFATPVGTITYSDSVTPTVIYGTQGGANGGYTVFRDGSGLELGLRARLRLTNTFDDQGNGTYGYFAPQGGAYGPFNIDFAVNSNYTGFSDTNLSTFTYVLGYDTNPAAGVSSGNTINLTTFCLDSQYGTNATSTNGGTVASCDPTSAAYFTKLMSANNAMQNSEPAPFAAAPGEYSFFLRALNSDNTIVGETDITVLVGTAPATVPEPAPLALMGLGLAGLVVARRRKNRA